MSSEPIRDPRTDWLLTPQNAALIVIDYQPVQVNSIRSMDHEVLVNNIIIVAKTAIAYISP
jgi:nicotinamidase-related amidase